VCERPCSFDAPGLARYARGPTPEGAVILTEIIIIFVLVLANGFFSGAEIAVIALRKARIQELANEGRASASAVLALRDNPERFLATVQVGITVVGATAAAFGGESIATRLAPRLARIDWIGPRAGALSLGIVIACISYLSIVIGELVPKSLALRGAETYALLVSRILLALSWIARPLVWLLGTSANIILRPFGDATTFTETRYSAEELQELVQDSSKGGMINADAGEIAARALEIADLTAGDVMVPRRNVVALAKSATQSELREIVDKRPHNRLPVYEDRIDNVVGYLSIKDMLATLLEGKPIIVEEIMREPYFVPDSQPAVALLNEMRRRRTPFAIVVDEQGGTSGIVTLEDLLEELVGDIYSEHSREVPQWIKKQPDGSFIVSGLAHIREVNRALDLELPEDGQWTTLAGLCLTLAARIPIAGEKFETKSGIGLEITDASPRRIRTVRIIPPAQPTAAAATPP
jgi:putative hemolysin